MALQEVSQKRTRCPWCGNREGIERVIEEVVKEMREGPPYTTPRQYQDLKWADRLAGVNAGEGKDE